MRVSIVGCGWYGWPLALHLKSLGYAVKGSKSTETGVEALSATGIESHLLCLDPQPVNVVNEALFAAEVLIVNIPPGRRPDVERYHWAQMQALEDHARGSSIRKVLFISSTSVYPDVNRTVTERDQLPADKAAGRALLRVEQFWRELAQVETTILRFGGLIGGERIPGRFLVGKRDVKNGDAPVNLIHLDDCLAITVQILKQGIWGETLNACCPGHPTRRAFYQAAAEKAGLDVSSFSDEPTIAFKQVDSSLLMDRLGYRFMHPDPMHFP